MELAYKSIFRFVNTLRHKAHVWLERVAIGWMVSGPSLAPFQVKFLPLAPLIPDKLRIHTMITLRRVEAVPRDDNVTR